MRGKGEGRSKRSRRRRASNERRKKDNEEDKRMRNKANERKMQGIKMCER